ncbi:hypothetical protein BDZ97DRAFT_1761996 [Flammula alnicola]|nr:hypothetical protein BDZ97DRAFT_1761996 [Flammula alnicola]
MGPKPKSTQKADHSAPKNTQKKKEDTTTKGRKKKGAPEEPEEKVEVGEIEIVWTKDLTWKLINSILEDGEVKQGLFPAPGANLSLSKGGSKTKSDYHWTLANLVFEDTSLGSLITAKDVDKKFWQLKIKNRLHALSKQTKEFIKEMGETGAGLNHADDVDMSMDSNITSCWSRIQEKHPWFWELKSLISERPNMVPVGIGNNSTGYNVSLLQKPSALAEGDSESRNSQFRESSRDFDSQSEPWTEALSLPPNFDEELERLDEDADNDEGVDNEGEEGTDDEHSAGQKRKGKDKKAEEPKKRVKHEEKKDVEEKKDDKKVTAPRPGKSAPATTQKKAKSGIDRFSEIAAKEEETTQKVIELKKTKAKGYADKEIAKVKSKAEVKMNQDRLKAELAAKAMELEAKKVELEFRLKLTQMTAAHHGANHTNLPPLPSLPVLPNIAESAFAPNVVGPAFTPNVLVKAHLPLALQNSFTVMY